MLAFLFSGVFVFRLFGLRRPLRLKLAHGEELEDAVLDVLEPIVVFGEHVRRGLQVDLVFGAVVPGQLRDPLEVGADDLVFRRLGVGAPQALEFPFDLDAGVVGEPQRLDPLAQIVQFGLLVLVAELATDLLHLFAKQHLALPLAQLLLHPGLDFLLRAEPHQLALHRDERLTHAVLVVEHLEQPLFLRGLQVQVEGHQIRERARLVDALDELVEGLGGDSAPGSQTRCAVAQFAVRA